MTVAYEDAFEQALAAVRAGDDVETAVARFPEHAARLREDLSLSAGLTRLAGTIGRPAPEARSAASNRLLSQLAAERAVPKKASRGPFSAFGWPRYAAAAAVVAVAVLGAGLLLDGGGSSVEAATIEGVVVENEGGTLTVQTLDALEQVMVPDDAPVSDVAGEPIELGGIEAGQVVMIKAERRGREVVAKRVQRFQDSLEAWCTDDSARCRLLTDELARAKDACERNPGACRVAMERLEALRLRAVDSTKLEELKQACRGGESDACRLIVAFCREHIPLCGAPAPGEPPAGDRPMLQNRLRMLLAACDAGDDAACRQVAAGCDRFSDLCPVDAPPPDTPSSAPPTAPRPDTSAGEGSPGPRPETTDSGSGPVRPSIAPTEVVATPVPGRPSTPRTDAAEPSGAPDAGRPDAAPR